MVEIYRNLNNGLLSIRDQKTKLVIGYAEFVRMVDVKFQVNENQRQQVIRNKQKNVHAFVCGTLVCVIGFTPRKNRTLPENTPCDDCSFEVAINPHDWVVKYNPYEHPYFHSEYNGCKIDFHEAKSIDICHNGQMRVIL